MAFTTRPELRGTFGAVTSTHWLASATGMSILEKGGNAFDAAVAAGFVLQVVEPHLNGPLGEVPILLHSVRDGGPRVLCGQGVAPGGATIDHFHSLGLDHVPGTGLLPAVVPGAFDAWCVLLRDYGTLTLGDVLTPAIGYAQNGFPLLAAVVKAIEGVVPLFEDAWPSSLAVYRPGGALPRADALFKNPALAVTFGRVLAAAKEAGGDRVAQIEAARGYFYRGPIAEVIERFCAENEFLDCSGRAHGGLLTRRDMADWQASYEKPVTYDYEGYQVCKTGPWGQGPVFLQQLALLKGFDLGAVDPSSAAFVHTVTECAKLALADREAYYADPDFVEVPLERLLTEDYNQERRRLIGETAAMELCPGTVAGYEGQVAAARRQEGAVEPGRGGDKGGIEEWVRTKKGSDGIEIQRSPGDTCHMDIIDCHGNMVSATPSGGWLQSSPVIPELGFCLGTRGQMFWLDEDSPSRLEPGKRPRTTLTPTLAYRDGEPAMVFGTPGGDQQDQWALIFFLRHVHHGLNLQACIDAPQFFNNHCNESFYPRRRAPGQLIVERQFPSGTIADLVAMGHRVRRAPAWSVGRMCAAARGEGMIMAAATPRLMQAYAVCR